MFNDNFSKRDYIRIARQLYYPEDVILRLKAAKNESELERIMITARKSL